MNIKIWERIVAGILSFGLLVAAQITEDTVLHYTGLITLFALVLSIIYFLVRRAHGGSGDALEMLLTRIAAYDKRIEMLEVEIIKLKSERDELKRQAHEYTSLRREIEAREYADLRKEQEAREMGNPVPETPLLVAVGADAMLKLDLASLRAVETDTGMEFRRIQNATLREIKRRLDRARGLGKPFDKLHLSVHSGPEGILLGGELVNSAEFSEILRGVRYLLIAGCQSSQIGDYLGVVPYVITMNEDVDNEDATRFARAWWTQIGLKVDPDPAFRAALKYSPSGMSEYVERHW